MRMPRCAQSAVHSQRRSARPSAQRPGYISEPNAARWPMLQVSGWQGAQALHADHGAAVAYRGMVDCFVRTVKEEGMQVGAVLRLEGWGSRGGRVSLGVGPTGLRWGSGCWGVAQ